MSEITDLTAAVKALTAQLQKGTSGPAAAEKRESLEQLRERQRLEKEIQDALRRDTLSRKEIAEERLAEGKQQLDNLREQLKLLDQTSDEYEVLREKILEAASAVKGYEENLEQVNKELKETAEATDEAKKELAKYNKELEGGKGKADQLLRKLLPLGGAMSTLATITPKSKGELIGFGKEMVRNIASGDLLAKMLLKLVSNSLEFALATDKANAAFKAATGAGDEFSGVIDEAGSRYLTYGVNAQDAGKATAALFGSFRDFTNLSESEQANIAATAATLDKFSVNAQTTGQILDQATKSLYMNSQQAETLTRQAATLARDIGKPISEVAGDLASAAPKLAFYGKQMFEVFAQLERQSKSTGLSVDSLLGLVGEKFDTFEGAGQAVGRLNAILGGPYLNSIDMLNASEADRLEMIKEAIDAGGVQFDQLNKFEQKAFASALGTDVDTLRRSLNKLDPEARSQAMTQEELAKRAGEARDIMTKLTDAINSLIVKNKPLIETIIKGVDKFSELIFQINKGEKSIIDLGKAIFGILPGWMKWVLGIGAAFKGISMVVGAVKGFLALRAAITAAQVSATAGFASMSAAASPLLAVLLPIAAILGGLGLGAFAISKASKAAAAGETGKAMGYGMGGGTASGALAGAGLGFMIGGPPGALIGGLIGGVAGLATGTLAAGGTFNDATMPAPIQMAKFNNQDTFERVGNSVVAAKPNGTLDKAIRDSNKEVVDAINALAAALNVKVYIGDEELGTAVSKGMNSFAGRQAISAYYQG